MLSTLQNSPASYEEYGVLSARDSRGSSHGVCRSGATTANPQRATTTALHPPMTNGWCLVLPAGALNIPTRPRQSGRRRMMWSPESVSTMSEISPTAKAYVASSKGFCICPRPNSPRSPPFRKLPQSDRCVAVLTKAACGSGAARMAVRSESNSVSASSFESVMRSPVRRDTGFREPVCLSSRCVARTDMVACFWTASSK
mmetsp:Transcript_16605/g.66997  ORF Transcript_16605/g.66997 Transcript_16605/m.66997 type:complete len:200 (-) Transcript_16605:1-600(-)